MDQAHFIRTPMVVRYLDPSNESALGPQYPYMVIVGALMYLANCTSPNILFAVNLLAHDYTEPGRIM